MVEERVSEKKAICAELEIKMLSEISTLVQTSATDKGSFEEILKLLGKIIDFRSASIYLCSKDKRQLEEVCTVGRRADLIDFVKFEMGNGISAWVAKHGRPIVLNNLRKSKGGTHTKSFLSVPMMFAKEIMGVINLAHDETEMFSKRDSEIVSVAGSMIALLVERISHEQILAERAAEFDSLKMELETARLRKAEMPPVSGDTSTSLYQKLSNPLAIISGNAQFLMMTLKTTNPSILKRLKAIDKEAGSIADISQNHLNVPAESRADFMLKGNSDPALVETR
jgi:transcriptional regulator with GAF, ATPase, and Fis domain